MSQAPRLAPAYRLVPAGPSDAEFLYHVYASTRADEMALAARLAADRWGPAQQESFLRMQWQAQASSYGLQFPGAEWLLILVEGHPAGRLIVDRPPDELHVIDIALLPDFRSRGVGSALLGALQVEAAARDVPIRLFVETWNPARRLYARLGFDALRADGLYLEMVWQPGHPA